MTDQKLERKLKTFKLVEGVSILSSILFISCIGGGLTLAFHETEKEHRNFSYVEPNQVTLSVRDIDGDKRKETIMRYEGREYILRYDKEKNQIIFGEK